MAAVQRASHLTQQLLQMARADAPLSETTQVDLMDLLRDAMSLHADTAAAQGSELELAGPDQLVLPANERLLRSIADNLLDNALRYGGTGSRVHVSVALEGQVAVLEVRDSGPGIAAEHHERVFERFWRPPGQPQPGSGLGLAIVREAARALGGDAHVLRQAPGSGAALQVRLPLSTSARARAVP
jgi:two-component system, OmpR family, sensor histidine kinase QseC